MWMTILARWQGRLPGLALRITGRISRTRRKSTIPAGSPGNPLVPCRISGSSCK
jgi:hypothetical protein